MSLVSVRALRVFSLLLVFGAVAAIARADLTWSPESGWSLQGGALAGVYGKSGEDALNLMNTARTAEEAGHVHTALKNYTKVTKRYPSSVYAPEAYYRIGLIRQKRGQIYKAFEAYQMILARYPNVRRYNELIADEYKIAYFMLNGGRNRIWGWLPGFSNRERGVQYFGVILADAPYGDYSALALMDIARGDQYLNNTDEAVDALDRLVNNYPDSPITPDAYLLLADLHAQQVEGPYYDQAETRQAITYDEDFMILFPNDPKIAQAATGLDAMKVTLAMSKIKIGDFYFYKRDNYPAARVFYNEAITSYPDSAVARLARQRLNAVEVKANAAAQGLPRKKHFLFF